MTLEKLQEIAGSLPEGPMRAEILLALRDTASLIAASKSELVMLWIGSVAPEGVELGWPTIRCDRPRRHGLITNPE